MAPGTPDTYFAARDRLRKSYRKTQVQYCLKAIGWLAALALFVVALRIVDRFINSDFSDLMLAIGLAYLGARAFTDAYMAVLEMAKIDKLKVNPSHRIDLIKSILNGVPFALYLRDYSSEKIIPHAGPGGTYDEIHRRSEKDLVEAFSEFVPVFSLVNSNGSTRGTARAVYLLNDQWLKQFKFFARQAAAIIIDADSCSPSLKKEYQYIAEIGALDRTLLVATEDVLGAFTGEAWVIGKAKCTLTRGSNYNGIAARSPHVSISPEIVGSILPDIHTKHRDINLILVEDDPELGQREFAFFEAGVPRPEECCDVVEDILSRMDLTKLPSKGVLRIKIQSNLGRPGL